MVVSQRKRSLPPAVAERYGDRLTALPVDVGQPKLCRRFVDDIVTVSDDSICAALALLFREAKLAVEPAAAAAIAAVLGPLAARLRGQHTGVVICGANIDSDSFYRYLKRGEAIRQ